ncbi:MAG TPA: sigma-70 family RNA polymerase sigma factor [Candidatus Dormibacteraeota bacterium]|jgi:RNA polymerase sigma-70 factor (ECF subfamily)|nr:sigma-70 family RNA polymerase sigma factor [Candidatus Dormibacteraeota bacterium]
MGFDPGSKPSFEELYREYLRRIYGYVRAQVGSPAEAEDLTSQVFVRAWEAYGRYLPQSQTPSAWLFRIARNLIVDRGRRGANAQKALRLVGQEIRPEPDPAQLAEEHIRDQQLLAAVVALSERQREVVSLRHAGGFGFMEIGGIMGVSEDAAKMLYHRALAKLREALPDMRPQ